MITYHVFGDYGYESECELYSHTSSAFAKRWAEGYTRRGEMGGYGVIEVAYFSDDGEYRPIWTQYAEEDEPDYGRSWYDTSAELA